MVKGRCDRPVYWILSCAHERNIDKKNSTFRSSNCLYNLVLQSVELAQLSRFFAFLKNRVAKFHGTGTMSINGN